MPVSSARTDLDRQTRVFETATGREMSLIELIDALAEHEAIFLGETHLDEVTHQLQLRIYEGLLERTGGNVVLAMEMFERDVQPVLDDYVHGRIDEATFLSQARPWGNYRTGYRPLIERARATARPVVASNTPISVRRQMAFGGQEAFENMAPEQRAYLPPELHPNTDHYWERFSRVVRGHGHAPSNPDPAAMLYSTQSLWDNTMGWSCAQALEEHPGHTLLHVNGGFHSAYKDGTVLQMLTRRPGTDVATVQISGAFDLSGLEPELEPTYADYVVFAEPRGRGLQDGRLAVHVPSPLEYRLHLPQGASTEDPVPLLVWLPGDGLTAEDGLALWRDEIGEEVAIAVPESPFPQLEENLRRGGRWYWEDSFSEDVSRLAFALDQMIENITAYQPVDPENVLLAGEGTGATVAIGSAWRNADFTRTIAADPERYAKLGEEGVGSPPEEPDTAERTVLVTEPDAAFWSQEIETRAEAGRPATLHQLGSREEVIDRLRQDVRTALGLEPLSPSDTPLVLTLTTDSPLGRQWARREAWELSRSGSPVTLAPLDAPPSDSTTRILAVRGEDGVPDEAAMFGPETFEDATKLPLAPGAFGGTTVLVVPAGASDEDRAAWEKLGEDDVLKKRSRFHSLRVAFESGEPSLPEVLSAVRESGRRNVLIVPAVYCADADHMRALRRSLGSDFEDMTIAWSPGVGGDL